MNDSDVKIKRLERKLIKKELRNKALEKRVRELERELSNQRITLPRDLERTVVNALCNVRMIPILGIGGNAKILDVSYSDPDKKK